MKRTIVALLAVTAMAGCAKNGGRAETPVPGEPVPVSLSASISAGTKAPVNEGDSFIAAIAGWESAAEVDYTQDASWYNEAAVTASEGSSVTLNPARTYRADDAIKTHMLAWHPAGEPAGGAVSFDNKGEVDAMVAAEVIGSARDYRNKTLVFTHPTTQLVFKLVADGTLDDGTQIRSITIKDAQIPVGFNIGAGAVNVNYASAADLSVPGIADETITPEGVTAGRPVMIKPFTGNKMNLDVVTSGGTFENVAVTIDGDENFQPGKAYEITLTFKQSEIVLRASVTPWDYSGSGAATIE